MRKIAAAIWLYRAVSDTITARLTIADSKDVMPVWDKTFLAAF